MKVSDIIYIMKILWRDLKKNSFMSFQRNTKIDLSIFSKSKQFFQKQTTPPLVTG